MSTIKLVFMNADATPKNTTIECTAASAPLIMAWYAPYHDGDRYAVAADGRNVPMDQNGEPTAAGMQVLGLPPEAEST